MHASTLRRSFSNGKSPPFVESFITKDGSSPAPSLTHLSLGPTPALHSVVSREFQIEGEFRGFFRNNISGKRRMAVRADAAELYLKVPKRLRETLRSALAPGQRIYIGGTLKFDRKTGKERRIVSHVRVADGALLTCPIRVCARKNCWRNGGKELYQALRDGIDKAGLADDVRLKRVDCLDHCKRGPNAACAGRNFHHCQPVDAAKILQPFLG